MLDLDVQLRVVGCWKTGGEASAFLFREARKAFQIGVVVRLIVGSVVGNRLCHGVFPSGRVDQHLTGRALLCLNLGRERP